MFNLPGVMCKGLTFNFNAKFLFIRLFCFREDNFQHTVLVTGFDLLLLDRHIY